MIDNWLIEWLVISSLRFYLGNGARARKVFYRACFVSKQAESKVRVTFAPSHSSLRIRLAHFNFRKAVFHQGLLFARIEDALI